MRQRRSLGSGMGDVETVPSEPEGVAGSSKTTTLTPVRLGCRTLSEYAQDSYNKEGLVVEFRCVRSFFQIFFHLDDSPFFVPLFDLSLFFPSPLFSLPC
jgi:hypothetical protein